MIRDAEAKAQEKAAGILKDADERIKTDTARARKKLEGELVGLIYDATEAIIGEKVDSAKDKELIERALKEQSA
jgi:F0F1-type ATP synthase membrane subunit b/b'